MGGLEEGANLPKEREMSETRRAVVTFYQTKYAFLDTVLRRFRRYASKIGADMVEINLDDSKNVFLDKFFHVGTLQYERCIVLDVDILIRSDAPDLFSIVPEDSVGAYDEGSSFFLSTRTETKDVDVRYQAYRHLIEWCGFDPSALSGKYSFSSPMRYYNLGVVVYNREAMDLHNSLTQEQVSRLNKYKGWNCVEQTLFSYLVLNSGIKTFHLPACFNQLPCNKCADYLKTSFFSHYAGLGDGKGAYIVEDDRVWSEQEL